VLRAGQVDGGGVVHADVDAAEGVDSLHDRRRDLVVVTDVADDRQR
jgi:hypothetical protein